VDQGRREAINSGGDITCPQYGHRLELKKDEVVEYLITTTWDAEAGVWIATSEDVPGLVLESGSLDALMAGR
jgi:hypothetical protein